MRDDFNAQGQQGMRKQYIDPASELYNAGIIRIEGQVDAAMASRLIPQLQQLDRMIQNGELHDLNGRPVDTIELQINSPGGSVVDGLAIYDIAVNKITTPIRTVGIGMQASMGSIFMAMGDERIMTKHSSLMIHQLSGGSQGQASEMSIRGDFSEDLHENLKSIYVERIGLKHEFWDRVLERDTWLSTEEALEMGFLTALAEPEKTSPYADAAKRDRSTSSAFASTVKHAADEAAHKWIQNASKEQLLLEMNNVSADGSAAGRYRSEMVVKLSKFPEMMVPAKRAEVEVASKKTNVKKLKP